MISYRYLNADSDGTHTSKSPDEYTSFLWIATLGVGYAVVASGYFLIDVLSRSEGGTNLQDTSNAIREGSAGFIRTLCWGITKISTGLVVVVYFLYYARGAPSFLKTYMSDGAYALIIGISFLMGAAFSAFAGFVGMWVAVRANVRVAHAASYSYFETLNIACRAGLVAGLLVVSCVIMGILILIFGITSFYPTIPLKLIPYSFIGYSFGASFVALFSQLGGGIYTKAADVGADMAGKLELGFNEDDPRNPGVIADLVGDNVGDCAGRASDLFESIAAEIIGAMILGASVSQNLPVEQAAGFIFFPLCVHCLDLLISSVGVLSLRSDTGPPRAYDPEFMGAANVEIGEDPLTILGRGYVVCTVLALIGLPLICRICLYVESTPNAWLYFAVCSWVGMFTGMAIIGISVYYTDCKFQPVQDVVQASNTGAGTNVIAGMAVGMNSTALPVLVLFVAVLSSYYLGFHSGISSMRQANAGLYGTAVATMGMLSTVVYILAMDVFGPISDNAGGIVEMSGMPPEHREITDAMDSVGNTTKAMTKAFSIGSAGLASLILFGAFIDEIEEVSGQSMGAIDLTQPEVFLSGFVGAALVFHFAGACMRAVGNAACEVVNNVRHQHEEHPEIMEGKALPDYNQCVVIVTQAAMREMVYPGGISLACPIILACLLRFFMSYGLGSALTCAQGIGAFLMFSTITGVILASFLNTSGATWDNAKKIVEARSGGKGSDSHAAAVVGDTVGDPCKDTAGPAIHVLIKMLSTLCLVLAPFFVAN